MGRPLRFVPEGHLVEVTCRTIHGRQLLRPSKKLNEIIVGALGRAQRLYGLQLFGVCFLSNHYHLLTGPDSAQQLSRFMAYANSKIAREVGRLHQWREKVWGRRYSAVVLSQEETVLVDRLRYCLANGVKESLVERVSQWPGVHCSEALLSGEPMLGWWFDRTREYRMKIRGKCVEPSEFATREQVLLSALPVWAHLSQDGVRARVQELIDDIESEAAVKRKNGSLGQPMGIARILEQEPQAIPKKLEKSPAPAFHAKSRAVLRELQEAYRAFVMAYLLAAGRLKQGEVNVKFPEGSFPPALPFVRGPFHLRP